MSKGMLTVFAIVFGIASIVAVNIGAKNSYMLGCERGVRFSCANHNAGCGDLKSIIKIAKEKCEQELY